MDTDTTEMLWHLLPLGPPLRLAVGAEEVGKSILSKTMIMFMDTDTTDRIFKRKTRAPPLHWLTRIRI